MVDGLHLSGKGAAVFAEGLSGAVASGLGKVRYLKAVTMCPAPGQITVILCVRRAATSQPGRIAANLFVRRPEKQVSVIVLLTVTNRFRLLPSIVV